MSFIPDNIQQTTIAAPNEAGIRGNDKHLASFRFPVFNRGRGVIVDSAIIVVLVFFIVGTIVQQALTNRFVESGMMSSMTVLPITVLGFALLFNLFAFSSWANQILFVTTSVVLMILTLTLSSWEFHCLFGLFASFYFLDSFIVHAIHMRSACTNPNTNANFSVSLRARWSLNDHAPVNLINFVYPLLALGLIAFLYRDLYANEIAVSERPVGILIDSYSINPIEKKIFNPLASSKQLHFVLTSILFLLLVPIVADFLMPFFKRKRFGAKRLFNETCSAVYSWFCYNSAHARGRAILATPAGNCAQRRMMSIGFIALFFPVVMPLTFHWIHLDKAAEEIQKRRRIKSFDIETDDYFQDNITRQYSQSRVVYRQDQEFSSDVMNLSPLKENNKEKEKSEELRRNLQNHLEHVKEKQRRDGITETFSEAPDKLFSHLPVLLSWILSPLNPFLFAFLLLFAGTSRSMALLTDLAGPIPNGNAYTTKNWPRIVDRLQKINQQHNQQEVLLGVHAHDQTPVIIPRSVLREHAHFLGDSGSGKSSLGISPLLSQLINFGDCSVIVLDLKADDQSLFELMREEAKQTSQVIDDSIDSRKWHYPFSYFAMDNKKPSHSFNPLTQTSFTSLEDVQRTEFLNTALGLYYGTEYGRKFYGDANFHALNTLISGNEVTSFSDLAESFSNGSFLRTDRDSRMAASNVKFSIERLAHINSLNATTESGPDQIDLSEIFSKPQCIYFSLPAVTGSVVSSDIGRLILYTILGAAQAAPKPRKQVFVVIDEFQRLVSGNIEVILQMARSLDIGLILSNQNLKDLNVEGTNLLPSVQTNTRLRQIFGIADSEEIKKLIEVSGEMTFFTRVFSEVASTLIPFFSILRESHQETISPRLRVNDIIQATDQAGRSIFVLRRGEGAAQFRGLPFIMESVYHIPPDLYQARQVASWPGETDSAKLISNDRLNSKQSQSSDPKNNSATKPIGDTPLFNSAPKEFSKNNTPEVAPDVLDDFLSTLDNFHNEN